MRKQLVFAGVAAAVLLLGASALAGAAEMAAPADTGYDRAALSQLGDVFTSEVTRVAVPV